MKSRRIVGPVPCADMVRFGKNGTPPPAPFAWPGPIPAATASRSADITAGRTGISVPPPAIAAYPLAVRELNPHLPYNDPGRWTSCWREYPGEFAAVILEPMNVAEPKPGYLAEVARLTRAHGALLVFDETITDFVTAWRRPGNIFGVTPDLATFGKGLANGFPCFRGGGPAGPMKRMEEIFFPSPSAADPLPGGLGRHLN